MIEILTDINQATPLWFTQRLQQHGLLSGGTVIDVQVVASKQTNVSLVYHLALEYSDTAASPTRLFLKLPNPNTAWVHKEVDFYRVLVPQMLSTSPNKHWLFPRCWDAAFSPETNQSHLILDDLSETHFTNPQALPPTQQLCEQVIDAYACFHAYWWEHAWLGSQVGEYLSEAAIDDFIHTTRQKLDSLLASVGDRLSSAQRKILEAVASAWPRRRRERVVQGQGVTLVHRDPHPLNFLYPLDTSQATVKLIDWQSWRIDTGTDDLAYLMACHWPSEQMTQSEREYVERYYSGLLRQGVRGYSWDDCWYDYCASIIRCLFFLLAAWSPAQGEGGTWWRRIQYGLAAYDRWACAEAFNK